MSWFSLLFCLFPTRCVRLGFVSRLTRGWNETTKFVMQIICRGVRGSRGMEILIWYEWWLRVCLKGRKVDRGVPEMRRYVSTRITFGGFHLKNRSETSVFLQVGLKPVSQFHLNQQCSRARRITADKLINAGFTSSRIFSVSSDAFSGVKVEQGR